MQTTSVNMKKLRLLLISFFTLFSGSLASAQSAAGTIVAGVPSSSEVWRTLGTLKFEEVPGRYIPAPKFTEAIKALQGKRVVLKGFIIPIEDTPQPKHFMLSLVPFSHCYFCGGAGPESVVEVESTVPFEVTNKPVQIAGILKLNADDENRMFYILEKAGPFF